MDYLSCRVVLVNTYGHMLPDMVITVMIIDFSVHATIEARFQPFPLLVMTTTVSLRVVLVVVWRVTICSLMMSCGIDSSVVA